MVHRLARLLIAPGLAAAGLALQPSAHAGIITSNVLTPGGSAQAGAAYSNFDTLASGSGSQTTSSGLNVAFSSGAAVVNGSAISQYVAPIFSGTNNTLFYPTGTAPANGTDATNYLATGTGSITFTNTAGPLGNYFGLLVGSLDTFNALTFNFADGSTSAVLTGAQLLPSANGTTTYYLNITTSSIISSVVATSGIASFEIDNVAFGTAAVPEPASLALVGLGLAGVGLAARRRRA